MNESGCDWSRAMDLKPLNRLPRPKGGAEGVFLGERREHGRGRELGRSDRHFAKGQEGQARSLRGHGRQFDLSAGFGDTQFYVSSELSGILSNTRLSFHVLRIRQVPLVQLNAGCVRDAAKSVEPGDSAAGIQITRRTQGLD